MHKDTSPAFLTLLARGVIFLFAVQAYLTTTVQAATITTATDTTVPTISFLTAKGITPFTAAITWTTSEPADGQVEFGTSSCPCILKTPVVSELSTTHSIDLHELVPSTKYYYRVISKDSAGNTKTSSTYSFATGATPDAAPPTVRVIPQEGNLWGVVTITAEAQDDKKVAGVRFIVDGNRERSEDAYAPYTLRWNTVKVPNGSHEIVAVARDTAGKYATSSAVVFTTANVKSLRVSASSLPSAEYREGTGLVFTSGFKVSLSGSALGPVAYKFYCNDPASGIPADAIAANIRETGDGMERFYVTKAACNYSAPGKYTAKIVVERDRATAWKQVSVTIPKDSTAPSLSAVTAQNVSEYTAAITWVTKETADGQVEFGTAACPCAFKTPLVSEFITSHTINLSGLSEGTKYYYRVISKDPSGNVRTSSTYSFHTAAIPDTIPPSAPDSLSAVASSASQINLAWSASMDNKGVTGYTVYRDSIKLTTTTKTTYSNSGLKSLTTHAYTVDAYDAAGNHSAQSVPVTATTKDTTVPTISSLTAKNITPFAADITWTTNEPADGQAELGTSYCPCQNKTPVVPDLLTAHTINLSGLTPATTYYYRVTSKDASGNLRTSSSYSFKTGAVETAALCNSVTGLSKPLAVCSQSNPCINGIQFSAGEVLQNITITSPTDVPVCAYGERVAWKDTEGTDRYACVFRPANVSGKLPVLVYFHGTGGNANNVFEYTSLREKATTFNLSGDSARNGFILVSVQGRNLHWPTMHPSGSHHDYYFRDISSVSANQDIAHADYLIDKLVSEGAVDQQRVYAMGWSNGATFAQLYSIARHKNPTPHGNFVAAAAVFALADPFNNISATQTPSCALDPYPLTDTPLYLVSRSCDALTACSAAQESFFSLPPGHSAESWVAKLRTAMGDQNVIFQIVNGLGAAANSCNITCTETIGTLNHLRWPNGVNDTGGVDWEPAMLEFLKNHPRR